MRRCARSCLCNRRPCARRGRRRSIYTAHAAEDHGGTGDQICRIACERRTQPKQDCVDGPLRHGTRDRVTALEAALRTAVACDVHFDAGARALYAADASNYRQVPIAVVLPRTTDDVVATVEVCREHGVPILPRGGGTSLAGQCCNAAVVIDMSRHLRTIVHIDPDRKTARIQPGLVLDDLQHALAPYGLV